MMYTDPTYMNMSENTKSERQNISLPPNKRYCGKLKFFDQNGNYG